MTRFVGVGPEPTHYTLHVAQYKRQTKNGKASWVGTGPTPTIIFYIVVSKDVFTNLYTKSRIDHL